MKNERIKAVAFNNRKKQLTVIYRTGKKAAVHYSSLGIRRNLVDAWIDQETGGRSVGIRFDTGKIDYMPYDQPLAIIKDPEFLLQSHIERITAQIKERLKQKRISKKFLAEQLHTSDNQIHRLLNPKILNKNLSQLYHIGLLLGLEPEFALKAA